MVRRRRCISLPCTEQNTVVAHGVAIEQACRELQIPTRGAGRVLVVAAASIEAQPVQRQVLVLQSFDRGSLVLDNFTGNFRVDLDQPCRQPVNVVQIVVGPTGFVGAPERAVVDYIRSTFADRPKPDLIVTVAGPAAVFARSIDRSSFPTRRSCSRPSTSDIFATRRLGRTRPRSRSPTIFRDRR